MELDELKHQLKNKLASDQGKSDADLALLLNKRTISIVGKLKRSLWIEIGFSILIVLAFIYIGITSNSHIYSVYFSVFSFPIAGFIIWLVYLLKRTTILSSTGLPVKGNLQRIVEIMENLIKRYFQFTMALLPICFIFILVLVYNDTGKFTSNISQRLAGNYFTTHWKLVVFMITYFILLYVLLYYFTKGYLRKLYGKYVAQLKECINELSEE